MYIKRVFSYSKWMGVILVLFAGLQLYINIKRGPECTPFYHFAMYSSFIKPTKRYHVLEVFANGKKLQTQNFSSQKWDHITLTLMAYEEQKTDNRYIWNHFLQKRLPASESSVYLNVLDDKGFMKWYKGYLSSVIHSQVDSVQFQYKTYRFNGASLNDE